MDQVLQLLGWYDDHHSFHGHSTIEEGILAAHMEVVQVGGEAGVKVGDLYRVKYDVDMDVGVGVGVGTDVGVDVDVGVSINGQPHIRRQWYVLRVNYWT